MNILKWICFLIVCLDTVSYIINQWQKADCVSRFIGLCIGIAARVYVLYGTTVYWLLA